ncbi:MAG: leucine-rich repeat domain-containing protein [Spirochaetaceae bacterium]|nr:leucine-rich repeat domain-containing protein [Spirochaetaceae bacterium]
MRFPGPQRSAAQAWRKAPIPTSVTFILSNDPPFDSSAVWKVYTQSSRGSPSAAVSALVSGATLTLTHATNIPAGSYWVTVTETDKSESGRLELTVTAYKGPYLDSVAAITSYLSSVSGGTTSANPVTLALSLNLADNTNGWIGLLTAINSAGKYVALDLSACTMAGNAQGVMEFDPDTFDAGKNRIVSLVLPGAAQSVKAGTEGAGQDAPVPAFRYFTSLKSIEGANITSIGDHAFSGCAALTTLRLPDDPPTLGDNVFTATYNSNTGSTTMIIQVPSGKATTYATSWGVSIITYVNGNTGRYGYDHKTIVITE